MSAGPLGRRPAKDMTPTSTALPGVRCVVHPQTHDGYHGQPFLSSRERMAS
jgi:hypothetical protein